MVICELGACVVVVEAPVGVLEVHCERRRQRVCRLQQILDITREVVVGHRPETQSAWTCEVVVAIRARSVLRITSLPTLSMDSQLQEVCFLVPQNSFFLLNFTGVAAAISARSPLASAPDRTLQSSWPHSKGLSFSRNLLCRSAKWWS